MTVPMMSEERTHDRSTSALRSTFAMLRVRQKIVPTRKAGNT